MDRHRKKEWKRQDRMRRIEEAHRPKVFFADLGLPFPLFEAPVEEATEYRGSGRCSLCGAEGVYCFDAGGVGGESQRLCCYACLRGGKAWFTKDSELGVIGYEEALEGLTAGRPGLRGGDFELVPHDDDPEWAGARVPSHWLFELLRTPTYSTWQGDNWQFCCRRPMVYVGIWKEGDFERFAAKGEGKALLAEALGENPDHFWGGLEQIGGPYMFRCTECGKYKGHHDNS